MGLVRRRLLDAEWDAPDCLDPRLWSLPAPLPFPVVPLALYFASRPWAPPSLPAVARAPPLLTPGPPPCPSRLALARSLPPAVLPMSLTMPRIPSASARALVLSLRLSSPAAACAFALPEPLPHSAAAQALALPSCLRPPRCRPCLCPSL